MLKRLAILALSASLQASAPMPGQTVKPSTQRSDQVEKQSAANHSAAAPAPSLVNKPVQPSAPNTDGSEVAGNDKKDTVTLTGLPPVTLVDKPKSFWDHVLDWGPWVFNAFLVIAALLQVWLLLRTWHEIRRQANAMDKTAIDTNAAATNASAIAKEAADAAKVSADAAKISADISAGVSVPTLVIHELGIGDVGAADVEAFFQCPKMKITIKNYGQTPAFLKWWSLCFTCEDLPEIPVYDGPGDGMILDKVVVESGGIFTLPELFYLRRHEFSLEDVRAIISREKTFRVYGYVCYGDIFGNPLRRLKFCETVLNIFNGELDSEEICDWWEGFAPPTYTGTDQLPTSKPRQRKPENPN